MSGDAERPPVRLEAREHRNGKWKKYPDGSGAGGEGEARARGSRMNKKKMKRKNGRKENKKSFLYRAMKPA